MRKGFVIVWRDLLDKALYKGSTPAQIKIWLAIVLLAAWKETEVDDGGEKITLHPGELLISGRALAAECGEGVTHMQVRTALKRFEKYGFLTQQITQSGTLISIVNWGKYQGFGSENNTAGNTAITQGQHSDNTAITHPLLRANPINKLTKEQGNHVTRESRGKSPTRKPFTPPTEDEVRNHWQEKSLHGDPEAFFDYYQANGWMAGKNHMKDWKAAARNWSRRERPVRRSTPFGDRMGRFYEAMKEDENHGGPADQGDRRDGGAF